MSNYLITGASRGLGLELARQFAALPEEQVRTIIAITRSANSPGLERLIAESQGRVVNIVITDITDESVVKSALPEIERHLPGGVLDVLINNAGVMPTPEGTMEAVSSAQLQDVFRTNVSSVQAMTSVLLPLLKRENTKKVINVYVDPTHRCCKAADTAIGPVPWVPFRGPRSIHWVLHTRTKSARLR